MHINKSNENNGGSKLPVNHTSDLVHKKGLVRITHKQQMLLMIAKKILSYQMLRIMRRIQMKKTQQFLRRWLNNTLRRRTSNQINK